MTNNGQKVIAVFGSAAPQPGSPDYDAAYQVGKLLAERGYAVINGGYGGVMGAASAGAKAANGHVIGVTSAIIETFRGEIPNPHLSETIRFENMRDRAVYVVTQNDGAIAMPGGVGTLTEIALMWNLLQVSDIPDRPLIVVGPMWRAMLDTMAREMSDYIRPRYYDLVDYADTGEAAVAMLAEQLG